MDRGTDGNPESFPLLEELVSQKMDSYYRFAGLSQEELEKKRKEEEENTKQELRLQAIKTKLFSCGGYPSVQKIKDAIPMAELYLHEQERIDSTRNNAQPIDRMQAEDFLKKLCNQLIHQEDAERKVYEEKEKIRRDGITEEEIDQIARARIMKKI